MTEFVDSKNFDQVLGQILARKEGKKIIKGQFDIDSVTLAHKLDFIMVLLASFQTIRGLTYKILFWDRIDSIKDLIESSEKKCQIASLYEGYEHPGVIFVDDKALDISFCKQLLVNHFNYEMAKTPSLNLRIQLCINHSYDVTLLDIYDDRGFYIYYLGYSPTGAGLSCAPE